MSEIDDLRKENDTLRALLGNSALPCVYCGLPAADQALCKSGFPGCSRADDQMLSQHFADGYRAEQAEKRLEWIYKNVFLVRDGVCTRFTGHVLGHYDSIEALVDAAVNPPVPPEPF